MSTRHELLLFHHRRTSTNSRYAGYTYQIQKISKVNMWKFSHFVFFNLNSSLACFSSSVNTPIHMFCDFCLMIGPLFGTITLHIRQWSRNHVRFRLSYLRAPMTELQLIPYVNMLILRLFRCLLHCWNLQDILKQITTFPTQDPSFWSHPLMNLAVLFNKSGLFHYSICN